MFTNHPNSESAFIDTQTSEGLLEAVKNYPKEALFIILNPNESKMYHMNMLLQKEDRVIRSVFWNTCWVWIGRLFFLAGLIALCVLGALTVL